MRSTAASSSIVPSNSVADFEVGVRTVPASRPVVDFSTLITISMSSIVIGSRYVVPRDQPSGLGVFPRVRNARRIHADGHEYQPETH
jgi:hypothetical protein